MTLLMPLQAVLVRISARLLKTTLQHTDERAKLEGELLDGVDVVKCMTWEVRMPPVAATKLTFFGSTSDFVRHMNELLFSDTIIFSCLLLGGADKCAVKCMTREISVLLLQQAQIQRCIRCRGRELLHLVHVSI